MARKLVLLLVNLLMRLLTRIEVEGRENVPAEGGVLVVINHLGRLDGPLLFISVPRKDINGWVAEKYQKYWIMRLMVKAVGGIWLNRHEADPGALRAGVNWLKAGKALGVAPEGTRSPTGALIEGKPGAAYAADLAGVPVVPAGIVMPDTAVRDALRLRRPRLRITYGQAFRLPRVGRGRRVQGLAENTEEIMCRIAALLPEHLRGVYAGHPRLQALLEEAADAQKPV
jgi:1-acyl-sn-glycerol-3-phosphate acyltransferase